MQRLADAFLKELEVACRSPGTIRSYRTTLDEFLAWCEEYGGVMRPKQITNDALHDYLAYLREREPTLAPRTVERMMSSVRNWRRWLAHHNHAPDIVNMPIAGGANKKLPRVLSRTEVEALLRAPDPETITGIRDRAILETLYSTGCRNAELCGIDKNQLDLGTGVVKVLGKGKKERLVVLGMQARRAVKAYLNHPERPMAHKGHGKALFLSKYGYRVQERTVHRVVEKAASKAGFERPVGPHVLRHSFATHLIRAGAPLLHVSKLLGHSTVATTEIYTHLAATDVLDAFDKFHPRAGDLDHRASG